MANATFYAEGRYLCEIVDQGLSTAKSGNMQIVFKVKVLEGTQPARDVKQYERSIYLTVTEKTMEYLVPKLQALGYHRDALRFLDLSQSQHHDLRGQQAEIFCKHEEGNDGNLREKWDIASSQSKPLDLVAPDSKVLRQLDALFGRQVKNSGGVVKPVAAKAAPADEPQEVDDSDVPF